MPHPDAGSLPLVPLWRINAIRFLFLLMALVMGTVVWRQLLFESAEWPLWKGVGKSMLAALAVISLLGVRFPLQMLPLMLYEIAWKTVWLVSVALRAWQAGYWNADLGSMFEDCIGIVVAYLVMPWRYVWKRYIAWPMEPMRSSRLPGRASD